MKQFFDVKDIAAIAQISESKAYFYIRQLNLELERSGYLTVRGKIPSSYFLRRFNLTEDHKNAENE